MLTREMEDVVVNKSGMLMHRGSEMHSRCVHHARKQTEVLCCLSCVLCLSECVQDEEVEERHGLLFNAIQVDRAK